MVKNQYIDGPAILFVDDDVGNLKVLQIHLAREFKILVAQNATEALGILDQRSHEIGLVVSDQRMAGMTGVEFLIIVRQRYPSIERMIITAYADLPPIIEAINDGQISGYISKPWNPTELRVLLRSGIERYSLRRSLDEAHLKILRTEQNSVLGFLAAGIGHEINNPASVIMINLQLILNQLAPLLEEWIAESSPEEAERREKLTQDMLDCVRESREAIIALTSISRDLRILSHLDESEHISLEATNINSTIKRSLRFLQKQIEYRGILRQDLRAENKTYVNPGKMTQVLINLCTNAIHAMDRVKDERTPVLTLSSWDDLDQDQVIIEVEDNGVGIPQDVLPRVFDPFFTTKENSMGLGLGLTISQNIIQHMGGKLEVSSTPNIGTSFLLRLPTEPRQADQEEAKTGDLKKRLSSNYSLLIIEDDEAVLNAIRKILSPYYNVESALGGGEGIEKIKEHEYDAIICDLMMPPPDGRDVYEYLHQHKPQKLSRLLFITGGTFTPSIQSFLQENSEPITILYKPFTFEQLTSAVEKLLPSSSRNNSTPDEISPDSKS